MKKLFFLCALLCASVAMFATTVSKDFSAQGYTNAQEITSISLDDNVTVTFDKGTNSNTPKYYDNGTAIRLYGGSTMTVTSSSDPIVAITLTFGADDGTNEFTVNVGDWASPTWTGQSSSVVFTEEGTKGNRRIKAIKVTYEASTTPLITAPAEVALGDFLPGSTIEDKEISIVALNYTDPLVATLSEGAAFAVEGTLTNEGGKLTISCTATEEGTYEATLTLSAGGVNVHSIALKARIAAPITIAEFLEKKDTENYNFLVGTIANIQMDKDDPTKINAYGNFDLVDAASDTIYVYGLLTAAGESRKFESMGLKEGDTLTLKGKYAEYKEAPQVGSGQYISHVPGTASALENATATEVKAVKVIENGQIFIIKEGVKYNIFGAEVK